MRMQRMKVDQKALMVRYMEEHPAFANDIFDDNLTMIGIKTLYGQWEHLTNMMNALRGGVRKDAESWRRTWESLRAKVRQKARLVNGTTENNLIQYQLSEMDERIYEIISKLPPYEVAPPVQSFQITTAPVKLKKTTLTQPVTAVQSLKIRARPIAVLKAVPPMSSSTPVQSLKTKTDIFMKNITEPPPESETNDPMWKIKEEPIDEMESVSPIKTLTTVKTFQIRANPARDNRTESSAETPTTEQVLKVKAKPIGIIKTASPTSMLTPVQTFHIRGDQFKEKTTKSLTDTPKMDNGLNIRMKPIEIMKRLSPIKTLTPIKALQIRKEPVKVKRVELPKKDSTANQPPLQIRVKPFKLMTAVPPMESSTSAIKLSTKPRSLLKDIHKRKQGMTTEQFQMKMLQFQEQKLIQKVKRNKIEDDKTKALIGLAKELLTFKEKLKQRDNLLKNNN